MIVPDNWIAEAEAGKITLAELGEKVLHLAKSFNQGDVESPDGCSCGQRLYHGMNQRIVNPHCPIHGKHKDRKTDIVRHGLAAGRNGEGKKQVERLYKVGGK